MAGFDDLMKRMGFVKLSSYGLLLTPDNRVMSMRPAVLDDGLGGKIVGWEDGDLVTMELQPWEPARPAETSAHGDARRRPPTPPPIPTAVKAATPASVVIATPAVAKLAPEPAVEENEEEWEWTIAMARARAVSEEVDAATSSLRPHNRRTHAETVPPVNAAAPSRPTQPVSFEDKTRPATEAARQLVARERASAPPPTVIPVPTMPVTATVTPRFTPVVRPTTAPQPTPRRFAKGTTPYARQDAPPPSDATVPDITLPPTTRLPSVKRVSRA